MQTIYKEIEEKMKQSLEAMRRQFLTMRTGRASAGLLENVKVDYYGTLTPVNQVAALSVPEARVLEIKPWDKEALGDIEKAILKTDLGLTPFNDGKVIRLKMPEPTQERRLELVKIIKKMAEDGKVALRAVRRDGMEKLKDREKNKQLSEDDGKKAQTHVQKMTDEYIKKIEEALATKEKEILEV